MQVAPLTSRPNDVVMYLEPIIACVQWRMIVSLNTTSECERHTSERGDLKGACDVGAKAC